MSRTKRAKLWWWPERSYGNKPVARKCFPSANHPKGFNTWDSMPSGSKWAKQEASAARRRYLNKQLREELSYE